MRTHKSLLKFVLLLLVALTSVTACGTKKVPQVAPAPSVQAPAAKSEDPKTVADLAKSVEDLKKQVEALQPKKPVAGTDPTKIVPTREEIDAAKAKILAKQNDPVIAAEIKRAREAEAKKVAEAELRSGATAEQRIALDLVEKNRKAEEGNAKDMRKARAEAGIVCSTLEQMQSVEIVDLSLFDRGGSATKLTVKVTNPHQFPISIEGDSGMVVRNLCAGGSISITRKVPWLADDNYTEQFRYTARAKFPDGILGFDESQQYSLYAGDARSGRRERTEYWTIQIQRR